MDIDFDLLKNNEGFNSFTDEEKTRYLEGLAERQPEYLRQSFISRANQFMEISSRESKKGRVKVDDRIRGTLREVLPADFNDLGKEQQIEAISKARPLVEDKASLVDPVNKNDTAYFADQALNSITRDILKDDVTEFGDKRNRFVGGLIQSFASQFGEQGVNQFLAENLPTNPDYDQTTASKLTQATGDFVGQFSQVIGITALASTGFGAPVALAGGIGAAAGFANNASRKFQENYNLARGEMGLTEDQALEAGIAGMPGAVIDTLGDTLLLRGVKLGTVSKAFKSMTAAEKAAEIVAKGGSVLKDPTALRTIGKNVATGFLKEGVSESLGDAATAWGGYATSNHEGFKPSAESLWESFWIGGVLGGGFSGALQTKGDLRNQRALKELGKINKDDFIALAEEQQTKIAELMDSENYDGALKLINEFQKKITPPDQQDNTGGQTDQEDQQQGETIDPSDIVDMGNGDIINLKDEKQKEESGFHDLEDDLLAVVNQLEPVGENPAIRSAHDRLMAAKPAARQAVRTYLSMNPDLNALEQGLDTLISIKQPTQANASQEGNIQQDNQQQPSQTQEGGLPTQTGVSDSANQGQTQTQEVNGQATTQEEVPANATPEGTQSETGQKAVSGAPEAAVEPAPVTPEVKKERVKRIRKKSSAAAKPLEADQQAATTPQAQNAPESQPEAIQGNLEPLTDDEIESVPDAVDEIKSEIETGKAESKKGIALIEKIEKAWDRFNNAKIKVEKRGAIEELRKLGALSDEESASMLDELDAKPKSNKEEEVSNENQTIKDDQLADARKYILDRIAKLEELVNLKRLMIDESAYTPEQHDADKAKVKGFITRANSAKKATELQKIDSDLSSAEEGKSIISDQDIDSIVKASRVALMRKQRGSAAQSKRVTQAVTPDESGRLFQGGANLANQKQDLVMLEGLSIGQLKSAKAVVQALRELGIDQQASDIDKELALDIQEAALKGSMSREINQKLNDAIPSRAIWQNKLNALIGFGNATKANLQLQYDIIGLNWLRTGGSLQAYWARMPDIKVVDREYYASADPKSFGGNQDLPFGTFVTDGVAAKFFVADSSRNGYPLHDSSSSDVNNNALFLATFSPVAGQILLTRGLYDATTMAHELDHNLIVTGTAERIVGPELWSEVEKELGMEGQPIWTVGAHEKWVAAREAWMRGREVSSTFQRVFAAMKKIYNRLFADGALDPYRNPVLEKAFAKIYDLNIEGRDLRNKVGRDYGYMASKLVGYVPLNKMAMAQSIMESASMQPDLDQAIAQLTKDATSIVGDRPAFTRYEADAMKATLREIYTQKKVAKEAPVIPDNEYYGVGAKVKSLIDNGIITQQEAVRMLYNAGAITEGEISNYEEYLNSISRASSQGQLFQSTSLGFKSERFISDYKPIDRIPPNSKASKAIARGEITPVNSSIGLGGTVTEVEIPSLNYLLPDGSKDDAELYHDTSVPNARKIIIQHIGRNRNTSIEVSSDIDLAIGQGGRGVKILFDSSTVSGVITNNEKNKTSIAINGNAVEFTIDRVTQRSISGILFDTQAKMKLFVDGLKGRERDAIINRFDFDNAEQRSLGITSNNKQGIYVPRKKPESQGQLFQYAGERANKPQFLTDSLETAKAMAAAGKSQEEIRAITGWFPSPYDGKMRWEIPDNEASLKLDFGSAKTISDLINHPLLFEAYPSLSSVPVEFRGFTAGITQDGKTLVLPAMTAGLSPDNRSLLNGALHEIQHLIQAIEGFARGGSPQTVYDPEIRRIAEKKAELERSRDEAKAAYEANRSDENLAAWKKAVDAVWDVMGEKPAKLPMESEMDYYRRIAGEIEARDVESRSNLTTEQRAAIAPYSSENIAPEEAIVLFQNTSRSTSPEVQQQVSRFNELTDSLYQGRDSVTQEEIDVWKEANPEAWEELSQMREDVLRKAGYTQEVFRAVRGKSPKALPREGYQVSFSTRKEVADSYGERDNDTSKFFLDPRSAEEFPSKNGDFSKTGFDQRVNDGGLIVARGVYDIGPFASTERDPEMLFSYSSDIYATKDTSKIKSADPISAGQKITPDQWADESNPSILFQRANQSQDETVRISIGFAAALLHDAANDMRSLRDAALAAGVSGAEVAKMDFGKDYKQIQKIYNRLVSSINREAGSYNPTSKQAVKDASKIIEMYREVYKAADPDKRKELSRVAGENYDHVSATGIEDDSMARENNIRRSKNMSEDEAQRVEYQDAIKYINRLFGSATGRKSLAARFRSHNSPQFMEAYRKLELLFSRGNDNVMGAFNDMNKDLFMSFHDNIKAYMGQNYEQTPAFIENWMDNLNQVEEEVFEFYIRQISAYKAPYMLAYGIDPEIDSIIDSINREPQESAMDYYERLDKSIKRIEAIMFMGGTDSDNPSESTKERRKEELQKKRLAIAERHKKALDEKFENFDEYLAYYESKHGGKLKENFRSVLQAAFKFIKETNPSNMDDVDLRNFNTIALTMLVGGNHTALLIPLKNAWRVDKIASWKRLVESMRTRVGESPLVRPIFRSAARSTILQRRFNDFDKKFQANVENFSVWLDRLSQYGPVRNWFEREFFSTFTTAAFTEAENAKKGDSQWFQSTIEDYNKSGTDNTVDANPYLWVYSLLSQYNLGADPNKTFANMVKKAQTSINKMKASMPSQMARNEADRNQVALDYMLEGIDTNSDTAYDDFMRKASEGRLGNGDLNKTKQRLELLQNISDYFSRDKANQVFVTEVIRGNPFTTVANYLPLKTVNIDGTPDRWDWTNMEPDVEHDPSAKNVNVNSQSERELSIGVDRAYVMDFFNMVERKLAKNAIDREVTLPVSILHDMFKGRRVEENGITELRPADPSMRAIFGDSQEAMQQIKTIKEKITHQMVQVYGMTEPADSFVSSAKKAIGFVQGTMLSGLGQFFQQSSAALVDYSLREEGNISYMIDAIRYYTRNYQVVRQWLLENNKDIYERGNTQGILEFERQINNAGSELSKVMKTMQGIDDIRRFMTLSLRYGDKIGAELIFLAEHRKQLEQSNKITRNAEYDIRDYSDPAITTAANNNLMRYIGPSSAAGRSYWMSDHKNTYFALRVLTGAFQSSAHNMSSQIISAARNIKNLQSDNSAEGKAERKAEYRKIGSIMAQQATFTTVRFLFSGMVTYAMVGAIRSMFDDEDGAIEELQLELERARKRAYPSPADKARAIAMAERKLADAKTIRRAVINMKQQTSGDAWWKSMARDQMMNLHIVNSVGDGLVTKGILMVPNMMQEASQKEAQDLTIAALKKDRSRAIKMGDRRKAAQISESIADAQAVEFIPYFYEKKDKSGFSGMIGGVLDPIMGAGIEASEDLTRDDRDFLTARAFIPDMITYMAAAGVGQADVNRIARQFQRLDDQLSKNRQKAEEKAGTEAEKLTNKPRRKYL